MEWLNPICDEIAKLPVGPTVMVVTLIIGFILKRTPAFPNGLIPLIAIIGGTAASVLFRYGYGKYILEGFIWSGLAWIFHRFIWKMFQEKFPILKGFKEFDEAAINPEPDDFPAVPSPTTPTELKDKVP